MKRREADEILRIAEAVRSACVAAALEGYERAQIAGLCQEGAWECAVDAIRMIELKALMNDPAEPRQPPLPRGPASA